MQRLFGRSQEGVLSQTQAGPRTGRPNKKAHPGSGWAFSFGAPGGDLLSRGQSALSSAQSRFTVLFGMGRRGSNSLWPPSKRGGGRLCGLRPAWVGRVALTIWKKYVWVWIGNTTTWLTLAFYAVLSTEHPALLFTQGYRIKSHGQLVSVSLTHYCASTPDLSTRWSTATL